MSTQIRYKKKPVVTFESGTVTLKTEDFGLEGDIEVVSEGGGSCEEAVLIPKTATENKTYYASDDGADGYSSVTVAVETGSGDSPLPIEIASASEMFNMLDNAEIGSVYKYTGPTTAAYESVIENGRLYIVEAVT